MTTRPIHTAETLDAMTAQERAALFEELGAEAYGTPRFRVRFAQDSGWARRTFDNWKSKPETMPVAAILLMQEWARRRTTPEILLAAVNDVARDLSNVATTMKGAARMVGQTLADERALATARRSEKPTPPEPDADERAPAASVGDIDESRL